MQTKFIAAAIAAAFLAAGAQADITVGGFLQTEVTYNKDQTNHDGKTDFYQGPSDVGSSIDVKGTHDITASGKLQWEVSTYLSKDTDVIPAGLGFFGDRKLYVRWADSFGTVTVGRDDSPIRMGFIGYDIFNGYASLGTLFDRGAASRPSKQIKYVSPKMGGLTVRASVQVDTTQGTNEPDQAFYTSVAYDLNPMFGFDFGYAAERDRGAVKGNDRNSVLAGVRGKVAEGLTYGVVFVNTEKWANEKAARSSGWMLGENMQYVTGDHTFRIAHTYADKSGANLFLAGYEYALPEVTMGSKKISSALYLEGSLIDNKADTDFVPGFKSSTVAGKDPATVALGVYVSF
ncbi:porin [Chitinibacter tainanensis]|uniref:porin n=1 Tax=Chitinibacter tainanensis TaxID=230667 RepID=UPI0003F561BF|nr:porin [Chitinibacter tainanensis]